jgi:tetratricopeptide (TPR) repeat protein
MAEENIEEEVSQQELEQQELDEISNDVDKKPVLDRNALILVGAVVAVVLIFGGIWGYDVFITQPKEIAAQEQNWWAENMLHFKEDTEASIEGDSSGFYDGFKYFVDDIAGTKSGKIARFDLGIAYLNKGEYQLARETLDGVDFGDVMVSAVAKGAIGDAYMQENDALKAADFYEQAVNYSDNSYTCPIYLKKAAFAHEVLGNWSSALANYERIKRDYPDSEQATSVEKYIVKAKSKV